MSMKTRPIALAALGLSLASSSAWATWQPVHSVESDTALVITDGQTGTTHPASLGYAVVSWQEGINKAFSQAVGQANGHVYEFRVLNLSATPDSDSIVGLWDVYRDDALVCGGCKGKAYQLSGAVGTALKIFVGTPSVYSEKWHFSGTITHRADY